MSDESIVCVRRKKDGKIFKVFDRHKDYYYRPNPEIKDWDKLPKEEYEVLKKEI